ncbi:MAG TPA: cyclase family protein, partial [Spirochaetota bacterium]|nr:cyclase family protein [Spirochaetota bacterium]
MPQKKNTFIDLSHSITDNMPVHPYDGNVSLCQDKFLHKDKYNNFVLQTGMHAGTHIDTAMHLTESNRYIGQISLESFAGRGVLLDVRGENEIMYRESYADNVKQDDIVILNTGFSEYYGTENYYTDHPVVSEELSHFFVKKKIKMLGIDMPSPDRYPFEIHKKLFSADIHIIENMTNLSELLSVVQFQVFAFPLKIMSEASPARVVAR